MRTSPSITVALALLSGFAMGACRVSRPNPEHCFYANGNQTCAEVDPIRPFCVTPTCSLEPYGCVAELPVETSCQSPCGGTQTAQDDSSCIAVGDDSGSEGEPRPDLAEGTTDDCEFHADCPPEAGFCFFGTCTPCDGTSDPDEACHVLSEGQAPLCVDGECVQCTHDDVDECSEVALTCDVQTHTCVPCTAHDQCPGGAACDLPLGTCLPADAVWHVDGDGGRDFTTVEAAMEALNGGSGTVIVHSLDGDGLYAEDVVISGDRSVALFGADGELPMFWASAEVSEGARLHARDLLFVGQTPVSVAGDAYVDLDSCVLAATSGYALSIVSGELRMRNTMLVSENAAAALYLFGHTRVDVVYSTLIVLGSGPAVSCPISPAIGSSIRNSVVLNEDPSPAISCLGLPFRNSVVDDPRADNTSVGDLVMDWFVWDGFPGDLHLSNVAPVAFSSAAIWELGGPTVDFDGDPRPTRAGSSDYAGADRLP